MGINWYPLRQSSKVGQELFIIHAQETRFRHTIQ